MGAVVLLGSLCVLLTGCFQGGLASIDDATTAMVARSQALTLGPASPNDPSRTPDRVLPPVVGSAAYRTKMPTANPTADELPAIPAGADQAAAYADAVAGGERDGAASEAQPPDHQLDLRAALALAIRQSPEYLGEKEDVYIAALDMLSEQHLWGPRFFSTFAATASGPTNGGDTRHALSVIQDFTVSHRLPNGGEVSATALVNYVDRLRLDGGTADDTQSASVSLELEQPLLRGAGAVARESLIRAKRELVYAVRRFERFRRSFLLDVSSDYFDLLQTQANVDNLRRQLENLDWLHKRIGALAKAGREAPFEVQRVGQQLLFARNNLNNAVQLYETALDRFKVRLGIAPQQRLAVLPTEVVIPTPQLQDKSAVATAHKLRLDLQTSQDRIDDARRAVANARNDLLPDLDLTARVTARTNGNEDFGGVTPDADSSSYSLGARYSAPLDRKRELIAYRRSIVRLEQSRRSHVLLRDQITQQVRRSIRQIGQAAFTLQQQNRNIDIAKKRLRGVVLRLRSLGPRDFIEAQDDLLEAQQRRDEAVRDIRVSVLQFLLDTGQMRVNPRGQWQPPAKLVAPNEEPNDANPAALLRSAKTASAEQLGDASRPRSKG